MGVCDMVRRFVDQPVLLAIGPGPLPDAVMDRALAALRREHAADRRLDILLFRDDPDGSLAARVRAAWTGPAQEVLGATYLASTADVTAQRVNDFVAALRERLTGIALATSGPLWARRFGSLWWKTTVSEKNSPADDIWWQFFRAAALRQRLQDDTYARCILVGDRWYVGLGQQVAARADIPSEGFATGGERFSFPRILATRAIGCFCLLAATGMARWYRRKHGEAMARRQPGDSSPCILLYTLFPATWTDRFGTWKDIYYGNMPRELSLQHNIEPVMALRAYDRTEFVTPRTYSRRLKLLSDPMRAPKRYVLMESFGSMLEVLRSYLSPWEVMRYFRMTRHPEFAQAFLWDGVDVGDMLKNRMWRSVLVAWPHLQVLQSNARRVAGYLRPEVAVAYCFEFIFGRATIEGARQGAPGAAIVGVQHGPISPMKLLYAGASVERFPSRFYGAPLPEPDIYIVDGPLGAQVLERRGIPPEMVRTVGAPRLDEVWAESRRLQRERKDRQRTRVLIAPGLHDTNYVIGTALKALAADARLELVLKPHPRVSRQAVAQWMQPYTRGGGSGAAITLADGGNIYEWMARSDIFLATYSSAAVEAIAFGLPVVLLLPNHAPDMSLFYGQGIPVLTAASASELREQVDRLVSGKLPLAEYLSSLSPALENCFGPTDSSASARLAKLLAELAVRRPTAVARDA